MRSGIGAITVVALALAVVIGGLAVAQAIRQGSLAPVWMVGWIPAVLAASLYPHRQRRCSYRPPERRRS